MMRSLFLGFCLLASASALAAAGKFELSSPDLPAGKPIGEEQVYAGFGCSGGNRSPALNWKNAPEGTRSFAVTVYDPDAPTGSGWWHWVIVNIPADTTSLPANAGDPKAGLAPKGAVQVRTDFGAPGYGGPCPPPGKPHRYIFSVFALKVDKLELKEDASAAMAGFMLNANALAKASFTRTYGR